MSGDVPKYFLNREVVSAVMARVPLMMLATRLTGTSMSRASWFWLMHSGARYSSARISPGGMGVSCGS